MPRPEGPTSRRHHTVPQFYLKGFADDDTLLTIALPGARRFRQSVRDASVVTNFYTLEGHVDGDDVLERELSKVESSAATVINRINAGLWPLPLDDRVTLAYFIALQATRTQGQRQTGNSIASFAARMQIGAGGKALFAEQLRGEGRVVPDEQVDRMWKQAISKEGPPVTLTSSEFVTQMLEMAEKLMGYLLIRPWTLFQFARRSLVTSDSPVGMMRGPDTAPWEGVGYATAWAMTYPLTRTLGLIMTNTDALTSAPEDEQILTGGYDQRKTGSTDTEKLINGHTIGSANKWLFLHPEDERFVPDELPEPRDMNVGISGDITFSE